MGTNPILTYKHVGAGRYHHKQHQENSIQRQEAINYAPRSPGRMHVLGDGFAKVVFLYMLGLLQSSTTV